MTIALPTYPVAYLMDNSEVYRGLRDLAYLESAAFADTAKAQLYDTAARGVASGIASMWSAGGARYDEEKQEPHGPLTRARWSVWYPDATAQLFPILQGVIPSDSRRARGLWASFNRAFPAWDRFRFPDNEPWALVAQTAVIEHDTTRANVYANSVQRRFSPSFAWPWYDMEAGWYMRTLESLLRLARRQGNPEQEANRLDL